MSSFWSDFNAATSSHLETVSLGQIKELESLSSLCIHLFQCVLHSENVSNVLKIQIEHTSSPQPLSFDQDWSEEHKLEENTSSSTISVRR